MEDPQPILPNAYIKTIAESQQGPPLPCYAKANVGNCVDNKVVENTACSLDLVQLTTWNPITTLSV